MHLPARPPPLPQALVESLPGAYPDGGAGQGRGSVRRPVGRCSVPSGAGGNPAFPAACIGSGRAVRLLPAKADPDVPAAVVRDPAAMRGAEAPPLRGGTPLAGAAALPGATRRPRNPIPARSMA